MLYWRVGNRINQEILKGKRAVYGAEIVSTVSRQLEAEYGVGFAEKNLRRMIQFAEVFPDEKIVVSLVRQLSWTHFIALIPLKDPLQREFYAEMCRVERWSVRTLRRKIASIALRNFPVPEIETPPQERRRADDTFIGGVNVGEDSVQPWNCQRRYYNKAFRCSA